MKRSLFALAITVLLSLGAHAQEAGSAQAGGRAMTLTGAVYDENGSVVVSDIKITARGADGKLYETATSDEGVYTLRLPHGFYTLEVRANGFCPVRVDHFRIVNAAHGRIAQDFVLEVASTAACARKPAGCQEPKRAGKEAVTIIE